MRLIQRAVLAAVISCAPAAKAAEHGVATALEMASYCKLVAEARIADRFVYFENSFEAGKCWGFFGAIQQAVRIREESNQNTFLGVCPPPESSLVQMVLIFRRYVEVNPSEGHENAFFVALRALAEAFPCKD